MAPYYAVEAAEPHLLRRDLTVNHTQAVTLGVMAAYVVVIALLWNLPYVRWSLWPFKLLLSMNLATPSPHAAQEAERHHSHHAPGWLSRSSIIGALLIFAGFNIIASKVASIILGVCFLLTLWWARRDWLTILTVLLAVGLLVACWFIAHGEALKWVVLFIGVMSALYSVWDICDDLILRKVNSSDASVFAKRYGGSSRCWGILWSLISLLFIAIAIVAALAAFPQSFSQQEDDSKHFLPTRIFHNGLILLNELRSFNPTYTCHRFMADRSERDGGAGHAPSIPKGTPKTPSIWSRLPETKSEMRSQRSLFFLFTPWYQVCLPCRKRQRSEETRRGTLSRQRDTARINSIDSPAVPRYYESLGRRRRRSPTLILKAWAASSEERSTTGPIDWTQWDDLLDQFQQQLVEDDFHAIDDHHS
ncbi:hypothetical protein AOCH_005340 [Aspergillus ochraceoroseus]|uniref:Uncharacterized protein n=1 Tax=Aspergillus ochraceoroseus TaxID=138278 RepID=A0A0F8UAY8_9EURO|nr:hypothetical protein AOCH_005340 [Aspergillus ochraceoroseus]